MANRTIEELNKSILIREYLQKRGTKDMNIEKEYEKKTHKILKTYNSILVKCKNIPLLSDKNIIMVETIEGMVNTQIEIRKPILYFQEEESISFLLLDGTETYVYIIKVHEEIENTVEKMIHHFEHARNTFLKEILAKMEKMLLTGTIGKEETIEKELIDSELKYLESRKEENNSKEENIKENHVKVKSIKEDNSKENRIKEDSLKVKNIQENNTKEKGKEEANSSQNLYLVPVKKQKKLSLFSRNKKSKADKKGRRRKIG